MNRIVFRLERRHLEPEGIEVTTIDPYVDDVHLRSLAGEVERPYAVADGQPGLAGSYAGLTAHARLLWPSRHFLGEPVECWFGDGDTVLLGCTCGEAGCWPLTARVIVLRATVEWRDFRTGHRSWDLSALGPFTFDRGQYETALAATAST